MRKIGFGIFITFLLTMSACKIECNSPQSARDDNYGVGSTNNEIASANDTTDTDDRTSGTTLSKEGTGNEVITNLAFKKGPLIADITYKGSAKFTVRIINSDGDTVAMLADKTENYVGRSLAKIPKDADNYMIEVKAEGEWQITLSKAEKNEK